jgi:SCY1-like protein 1
LAAQGITLCLPLASPKALTPIIKIGSRLETPEFESLIVPIIVKLFALPDRAMRITLCENLSGIIEHLSMNTVSKLIFPNLATGFHDASPPVREKTLMAILVIIPKLSENIINNDLLRYLAKLQTGDALI